MASSSYPVAARRFSPPRVSVITIFYNEERFIREAVESVLAQSFTDYELILVDDGSSDSSSYIARQYAVQRPERIRYLAHPNHSNRGMSASRNLGVSEARGELIAFLDADDRWRPSKLEEQIEVLDGLPDVAAVGGAVNYWSSHDGGRDRIVPTGHVRHRVIDRVEAALRLYPLGVADAPSMSDLLFRRPSIDAVGGFEDRFTGAYEDQAFLAKFYLKGRLYFSDTVWSDYRLHAQSCMAQVRRAGRYHNSRCAFLEWFQRYLAESEPEADSRVRSAVEEALRPYRAKHGIRDAARRLPLAITIVRSAKSVAGRMRTLVAAGPAILMYHRVAKANFDPWGLAVSPERFVEQMNWTLRNRTPLPLAEFADLHRRGCLPSNAIAVTFDDGYACNMSAAIPILERLGIPATIFVPSDLVDAGREFWWDELERIVLGHDGDTLSLNGHQIELGNKRADDKDWPPSEPPRTPRQVAYRNLWSMLYRRDPKALEEGITRLRDQAAVPDRPRESHRPMTRAELSRIVSEATEIGSHSLSHASLPHLDPDEKAREIQISRERCAELSGAEPRSFSYPYGDFDSESERLVQEAGYVCAVKADGWFVRRRTSRFALPRIFVGDWDSARLARRLGRP